MTRLRRGFTLIELLIVVVIIGVIAAIAIPKFADTKRKAHVTAIKADLRRMSVGAEAYFADNNTYAGYVVPPGSPNVVISFFGEPSSWIAWGTHNGAPNALCYLGNNRGYWNLREGQLGGPDCK
jgi:type IV pilus assembly protein PilA